MRKLMIVCMALALFGCSRSRPDANEEKDFRAIGEPCNGIPRLIHSYGTSGNGNLQFATPHGVAPLGTDQLVVADTNNQRVQVLTKAGAYSSQWATGAGTGPRGITSDSDGKVFVSLSTANVVKKYNPANGNELASWGSAGAGATQLQSPYAVALFNNILYVADVQNDRVQKYDATQSGQHIGTLGPTFMRGDTPDQFVHPHGLGIFNSELYVVDTFGAGGGLNQGGRVVVFNLDGTYQRMWSDNGEGAFLAEPYGIAFDAGSNVYVGEHGGSRVRKFTTTGLYLGKFGRNELGQMQMLAPRFMFAEGCTVTLVDGFDRVAIWHPCAFYPTVMACVDVDGGMQGRTDQQITDDCAAVVNGYGYAAASNDSLACNDFCVVNTKVSRNANCPL